MKEPHVQALTSRLAMVFGAAGLTIETCSGAGRCVKGCSEEEKEQTRSKGTIQEQGSARRRRKIDHACARQEGAIRAKYPG